MRRIFNFGHLLQKSGVSYHGGVVLHFGDLMKRKRIEWHRHDNNNTAEWRTVALLIALFLAALCKADDARSLHDYAHASGGALATYGGYGIAKIVTSDKFTAWLVGTGIGMAACIGKEVHDKATGGRFSNRDLAYCGAGATAAAITIPVFGF